MVSARLSRMKFFNQRISPVAGFRILYTIWLNGMIYVLRKYVDPDGEWYDFDEMREFFSQSNNQIAIEIIDPERFTLTLLEMS